MRIRRATEADAAAAAEVLRRSIAELCRADHQDDPVVLTGWLANKTPETVAAWIADPDSVVMVAVDDDGAIAGVGSAAASGEITLNYVSPTFRFRGVSKAMVAELERHLASLGCHRAKLTSTITAHRFYLCAGYRDDGPPKPWRGGNIHPMVKRLA
ncbi:GNAT family N-acetyltransferase [Phreatobacter stygius]|uniref:GNAT family N-acetyltransferase n=1 Tax=Phreatobacter stygius TaxID=1940610 RepID=A0A4D7BEX1_9HYPH|nr:GNAT family N-acetyltransferase [Phreatobacter stygius]QCI66502.1 GNAT family N-acetyltransferase [Phreatobacter stygius]